MEGTYPLPEAQLDRFLMKILVAYPSREELNRIVERTIQQDETHVEPVLDRAAIQEVRTVCRQVLVAPHVQEMAIALVMATQPDQLSRQLDELWKKCLSHVGLNVDFRAAKWPENLKNSRAGKLMMWRVGWTAAQPDGDTFLALGYGPNKGQANHSRFDQRDFNALYAKQRTLPDGPEREAIFHAAKKLFVAYAPYKFLGHRIETSVYHPWVIGFRRHPFMRDFWKYVDIDENVDAKSTT